MQQESKHESGTFNSSLDISEYIGIAVLIVSYLPILCFILAPRPVLFGM
jgi:hypothetical protein